MLKNNRALRRLTCLLASVALAALTVGASPFEVNGSVKPRSSGQRDASPPEVAQQRGKTRRGRTRRGQTKTPDKTPTLIGEGTDTGGDEEIEPAHIIEMTASTTPPPALGCGLGKGHNAVTGMIDVSTLKAGHEVVNVRFDDTNPANEQRTVISLIINGTTYKYFDDFNGESNIAKLTLPQGLFLMVGDNVSVKIEEQYTVAATSTSSSCLKTLVTTVPSRRVLFNANPILLRHSSANQSPGCHGQAVKFDGVYFFSACQELAGSDSLAVANIHDAEGNRLCRFELGESYDHPGGIVIYPGEIGTAYLGFSKWAGDAPDSDDNMAQPIKIAYDHAAKKCASAPVKLNAGQDVGRTIGFAVRFPDSICTKTTTWKPDIYFYDDYTDNVTICKKTDPPPSCSYLDVPAPTFENSSQDCGYYWEGAWFKACIALAIDGQNEIQVFRADAVHMHVRLKSFLLGSSTRNWSGGFDIYQSRDGTQRYVILAPDNDSVSDNCDFRQPCTTNDSNKAQYVEVHNFYNWRAYWPTNTTTTEKICK